jgi:hypothetical protein
VATRIELAIIDQLPAWRRVKSPFWKVNTLDSFKTAPDLFQFISIENEQFLNTLASFDIEKDILAILQSLYAEVVPKLKINENDIVLYQLLTLTHYHFLFSLSCFMRCHLSEAFASVRVAIDAALVASQIIKHRDSQVAYVKREKPFDKLNRHLKNTVKNGGDLHHTVPHLLKLHDSVSSFASHADINSFVHRVSFRPDGIDLQYFQFSTDESHRKIHVLSIFHCFAMILDVFADFLIDERQQVPADWRQRVHDLGKYIEQQRHVLKGQED